MEDQPHITLTTAGAEQLLVCIQPSRGKREAMCEQGMGTHVREPTLTTNFFGLGKK